MDAPVLYENFNRHSMNCESEKPLTDLPRSRYNQGQEDQKVDQAPSLTRLTFSRSFPLGIVKHLNDDISESGDPESGDRETSENKEGNEAEDAQSLEGSGRVQEE